ncbi:MAG: peptidylprolyl isomerase [Bdellovibrionaceae bacterium]|jgi:peptidyl-prolyl cis-trans isomerase A (cyclophilin A)|nr:peptidylprolyl isomerase [Pseudobdellovibrionaceae bacterium]
MILKKNSTILTALLIYVCSFLLFSIPGKAETSPAKVKASKQSAITPDKSVDLSKGPKTNKDSTSVYAILNISWGKKAKNNSKVKIKLYHKRAPNTVKNFTDLAEGKKEFKIKGRPYTKRFYKNLIFHRIIRGFMIQGGDPSGNGTGGPGYKFKDEFHPALKHNKPGTVSMANAGPNTNGSQFFITVGDQSHLDRPTKKYSIFGKVVEGLNEIVKISKIRTNRLDQPKHPVTITSVVIERK